MRVRGMLSEAEAAFLLFLPLLLAAHANAQPVHYLPDIPGYIPVYIRHGDQPLEEINLALAEAFQESTGIIKNTQKNSTISPTIDTSNKNLTDVNNISWQSEEEKAAEKNFIPLTPPKQLIYALPQQKNIFIYNPEPSVKESVIMKLHKPSQKTELKKISKEIKHKEIK